MPRGSKTLSKEQLAEHKENRRKGVAGARAKRTKDLALYDGSTPLTIVRMEKYVGYRLAGFTRMDSALKAGYPLSRARSSGSLENDPSIKKRLVYKKRQLSEWFDTEAKKNLQAMACTAYADLIDFFDEEGNIKPIHEIPKYARLAMSGVEVNEIYEGRGKSKKFIGVMKKIKLADRNKAQENIARILGQIGPKEGEGGAPVQHLVINFNDVRVDEVKVANIKRDDDRS